MIQVLKFQSIPVTFWASLIWIHFKYDNNELKVKMLFR
jgi:hypothetical protein